ncbi:HNH endonuclease signature motif containing protein [Atlantibacter sp.]|uniref:HNH endonuclease n=1 Tax=Atlantibacter sp. TaxID=1903473 RepID=UPI0028B131E2|nr:HNH endonuclease signature motif containing protein [Atlantibacter sp.]
MKINDANGVEIDSEMSIVFEDGYFGLILESWGPKVRNKDYNKALEVIIHRLKLSGLKRIEIFLASSGIRKSLNNMNDRRIKNHVDGFFYIDKDSAIDNRLNISKSQKFFDATGKKQVASGNGTKRILIHAKDLNSEDAWMQILDFNYKLPLKVANISNLKEKDPSKYLQMPAIKPEGQINPLRITKTVNVFERDPKVVEWVLFTSYGKCENCNSDAPFISINGEPFLEVHHVVSLSAGGPDTVDNCVALCPNCHRKMHFSNEHEDLKSALYSKITRLKKYNC